MLRFKEVFIYQFFRYFSLNYLFSGYIIFFYSAFLSRQQSTIRILSCPKYFCFTCLASCICKVFILMWYEIIQLEMTKDWFLWHFPQCQTCLFVNCAHFLCVFYICVGLCLSVSLTCLMQRKVLAKDQ